MRVGKKRVLEAYLGAYPIKAIYIGTDLVYERNTGEIEYRLSSDGTYAIVVGLGINATNTIVIADKYKNKPVKEISANAFNGANITSVTIPENVTSIGNYAFKNCTSLGTVNFNPTNFTNVVDSSHSPFQNAGNSSSFVINVGKDVKRIPSYTFTNNKNITQVDLSKTTDCIISFYAFKGCSKLSNLKLPNNVKGIYNDAFKGTSLGYEITLPTELGLLEDAFDCKSFVYNKKIGDWCKMVSNTNTESLDWVTFSSLETVKIKPSVISGQNIDSTILIPYSSTTTIISSFSGYPMERVVISKGMEFINEQCFAYCSNLKEIYIPKSITYISNDAFNAVPSGMTIYYEGNFDEWDVIFRDNTVNDGRHLVKFNKKGYTFTTT